MSAPMNADLKRERKNASFNPIHMTYFLDNGKQFTERRRELEKLVMEDPDFKDMPDVNLMTRDEQYSEGMRKTMLVNKKIGELNLTHPLEKAIYSRTVFPNENRPDTLHHSMFLTTLEKQLSPEQKAKWLPLAKSMKIIGTYAQTELGHGTYLRGLETESVYDPSKQEFVINSPTLTATKFWPGGLGKTCNFAVVMANLKIGERNHGMHSFMVQLRDLDTHQPCPGVKLGDIGPKLGYSMIDNGFARFDHVRVPRENMLMKHASVSPEGAYERTAGSKLGYFTMVFIRAFIIREPVTNSLAQGCTIAIRYSAVRRQSEMRPGEPEPQVLDFQTQQYKVFPVLATTYAFHLASFSMAQTYLAIEGEIADGKTDRLAELHALSAGLKAFSSSEANVLLEQLRLACGGHGYSQASGFPKLYGNMTPACTYEGENTVMFLQCARYLVKAYDQIKRGSIGSFEGTSVAYLGHPIRSRSALCEKLDLQHLAEAYQHRADRCIGQAVNSIAALMKAGKDQIDATNLSSVALVKAAQAHSHSFIVQNFVKVSTRVSSVPDNVKKVLQTLCRLYAVHGMVEHAGDFIQDGYINGKQLSILETAQLDLLAQIRPNAVALVDAFDIPDFVLRSCLGRYDGRVYESLMEFAAKSPLNKTEVHEAFHKYVKPLRETLAAKL